MLAPTSTTPSNSPIYSNTSLPGSSSTTSSGYSGSSSTSSSSTSTTTNSGLALTPNDFINMMITQLKNQDPTQPTSNADLLQEMSQIGQLQSQQSLQTNLQAMVLQNQIGSASNFLGKSVTGLDSNNDSINGVVDSVHVENGGVNLVLDSGASLALNRLTDVDGGSSSATTTGTATASELSAGTAVGGNSTSGSGT